MTEVPAVPQTLLPSAVEQALVSGDLSGLNAEQRVRLYYHTCASLGLNPLTRPFEYLNLNGKLRLYATRNCTDQLRVLRSVNLAVVSREKIEDLYVVTVRASIPGGRQDEEIGAVPIGNAKGEALANAMMKATTKAKRRVTLSIAGLSFLDEGEVETIPGAIVDFPERFEVQQGMDRFHARDAEVQRELSRAAAEEAQTSGVPPAPFVHAEKTPSGISSMATASPSTPPQEAGANATERKPRPRRQAQNHLPISEALKAVSHHLTRLCGASKQDALDLSRSMWGKGIQDWQSVKDLPEEEIRRGLATLEKMIPDQPPPEEDVPSFPPPEGSPEPGPTQDAGADSNNAPGSTIERGGIGHPSDPPQENATTGLPDVKAHCSAIQPETGFHCVRDAHTTGAHYFAPPRPEELFATRQATNQAQLREVRT